MAASDGVISRFRQPECTGENRCMLCTVANTLMTVVQAAQRGLMMRW